MTSHIPNVPLLTQENRRVRFYDDLIKGRVVLINFMFATCDGACPRTSANLRNVQKALGAHSGRDVFLCSLTLGLEHDTPEVLRDYSKSLGAAPGWTFLTGRPEELELLRRSLGFTDPDPKVDADKTKHSGIAVFGDDAGGRWSMMPAVVDPNRIVSALRRLLSFRPGVSEGEFNGKKRRPPGAPLFRSDKQAVSRS